MRTRLAFFAAATLAACGTYHQKPVVVSGPRDRIAALAGQWEGAYYGNDSRRYGSILFTVRASGDSAYGDVLMQRDNGSTPGASDASAQHPTPAAIPQLLSISFVSVSDSAVRGRLKPYTAPDCQCTVTTVFTGRQRGDSIEGTFITEGQLLAAQIGHWRVVRKR